jgi:adenosylhomocysteine nucleosidase
VGIIIALDDTFKQLQKEMSNTKCSVVSGRTFLQGKVNKIPVILVQSPMGKVNNAITTQLLISKFNVKGILSLSPAGALVDTLQVGDVLVATKVYQHDFGTWKPYGFIWGQVPVSNPDITLNYNVSPIHKIPDLAKMAKSESRVLHGTVVSGDQFISTEEKRHWLNKKFHADAVDMGAAAIVQTCYGSNTPVIILRIITDFAGQNARVTFSESMPAYQTDIDVKEITLHLSEFLTNPR